MKQLFLSLALLLTLNGIGQENWYVDMIIDLLSQMAEETPSHYLVDKDRVSKKMKSARFYKTANGVKIENDWDEFKNHNEFNPLLINKVVIRNINENSQLGQVIIYFKEPVVSRTYTYASGKVTSTKVDFAHFTYVRTDSTLDQAMKNGFLRLKEQYAGSGSQSSTVSSTTTRPASLSVKIGNAEWMTENLNVGYFRNGDAIPQARTEDDWNYALSNGTPAWCYYEFDANNGKKYGRLYNFYAVSDKRGLAPQGWHVASQEEWSQLVKLSGGSDEAGKKLKSTSGWTPSERSPEYANGTNESGFTALPGGYRRPGGSGYGFGEGFIFIGESATWWTSNVFTGANAGVVEIKNYTFKVETKYYHKNWGFSVRCVKN